jgi:ipoprotein LpqH
MQIRILGLAGAALTTATVIAGCGLTGSEPAEPPAKSGRITMGDKTRNTQTVLCTQQQWLMTIEATANPGTARASLNLGGDKPSVNTVSIENLDGLHGVAGSGVGKAEANFNGSVYSITGTAVVSDPNKPGESTTLPFRIEAPC